MLNFKNMKIFGKLISSFSVVALICAIVGAVGWYGIRQTENALNEVAEVRLPAIEGLGLMMESMNAIKSAERTMIISSISGSARQHEIDNLVTRWAEFDRGFNLFEPLPKTAEGTILWKKFLPILETWKKEHRKLTEEADKVKIADVESLEAILVGRKLDHIRWVGLLDKAVIEHQKFTGQLNPALCGLGKWLEKYSSEDPSFNAILGQFHDPHSRLHNYGEKINELIAKGQYGEAKKLFTDEVVPTLVSIEAKFDEAIRVVASYDENLRRAIEIGFGSEREAFGETMKTLDEIFELNAKAAEQAMIDGEETANRSKITALVAVLLGMFIAITFGYLIAGMIATPLNKTVEMLKEMGKGHLDMRLNLDLNDEIGIMAKNMDEFADSLKNELVAALVKLANGDLTFEAIPQDSKDAIRNALKKTGDDLNDIMTQMNLAGEQVASASGQVSDASQSLSQGATESASSLEEITSSMTEMGSQTKQNAENANQANQLAGQARDAAEGGNKQMEEMVKAMSEISESAQNISKIIKVIDEIAFQTNLLALNAAVEAARAGRHGKGFAVVAEEVRNLAARSAKAAGETAVLIEGSVKKTENGSEIADRTAEALKDIVSSVSKVTDLVAEIAASSNEQAQGISQVNEGLAQIDQVTQQNTANAEESAAAAEELSSQAAQLRGMLGRFILKNDTGGRQQFTPYKQAALPQTPRRSGHDEWGEASARDAKQIKPSDVIALDDTEFGKY
ncbi:MAG: MCP four helix bundle domain-containing protein [Proteobacteria bacterium]|nr:MCP four helix bundle domain-containing protein [Pseudomonadota bacterium]MBU1717075.1 MCP four helix bundle domain-containing protein [Pseudomonadota bacterium]